VAVIRQKGTRIKLNPLSWRGLKTFDL